MSETQVSDMSFEQAMAELDQVVSKLERGDVALEDSIRLYERGAALKAHCERKLKEAEEKVEKITVGPDGNAAGTSKADV
ncbi:exodeoxyribonuclease VII small subunit [Celeribacter indicus]|nr:exodeoxyribonuclease VII small subunit [Celeribacter indicus]SDW94742.1 Exodeoxyribonuclease VII small subunit [Celeribacter indicus]